MRTGRARIAETRAQAARPEAQLSLLADVEETPQLGVQLAEAGVAHVLALEAADEPVRGVVRDAVSLGELAPGSLVSSWTKAKSS